MTGEDTGKKLSRRQFVGTAAAGVLALGVAAGGTSLIPRVAAAGEKALGAASGTGAPSGPVMQGPWLPSSWDYTADVVVVGFGGAGAAAAISANDAGANVLILEKMPHGLEGGNTCISGGGTTWPWDTWKATDHIWGLSMGDTDCPTADYDLIGAWANQMSNVLAYEAKIGLKTTLGIHDYSHFFCTAPDIAGPGSRHESGLNSYSPTYTAKPQLTGGRALFTAAYDSVVSRNIQVLYETPFVDFVQDPATKQILGVQATQGGATIYVKASRGVVMALGGYENSPELQSWFLTPGVRVYPGGTPGNTGDGIYAIQRIGGVVWHMQGEEWNSLCFLIPPSLMAAPWPQDQYAVMPITPSFANSYIIVNKYGNRFYNNISAESGGHCHNKILAGFQDFSYFDGNANDATSKSEFTNSPFYIIMDSNCITSHSFFSGIDTFGFGPTWNLAKGTQLYVPSTDNSKEIAAGIITQAPDIPTLASYLGISNTATTGQLSPAANGPGLAGTITNWNNYCTAGSDPEFGVPKSALIPISKAPYYGARLHICFLNTQGGAKRNEHAEIVDMYDQPIPRLFGAGEFGSIYGALYHGSGNNAESCCVGTIAGANAAALVPWSS